jgi:nucleoside 2-deoxyribosyltransferase
MKIYIAGKFAAKARLAEEKRKLQAMGVEVSSTWLTDHSDSLSSVAMTPEHNLQLALRDVDEVAKADGIILDTLDESNTGGREVEFGTAIALENETVVIGPRRNVFHYMADYHFDTWDEFYEAYEARSDS